MPITVTLQKVKQKVKNSYIEMAKEKQKDIKEKLKYKPPVTTNRVAVKAGASIMSNNARNSKITNKSNSMIRGGM